MPIFCQDSLECQQARVAAAKEKLAETARRKPVRPETAVIDRKTGTITPLSGGGSGRGPMGMVTHFAATHPLATAAVTLGLMAALGPMRLLRLGFVATRGVGMVMAAKKAVQSVDVRM